MASTANERRIDWNAIWRGGYGFYQIQQTVGYRLSLEGHIHLPDENHTGPALFVDSDGGPTFIGSALYGDSVQPCKIVPRWPPSCHFAYETREIAHDGRYTLLPFDSKSMEWVFTSGGRIPENRTPIEGGHEATGEKLYHAVGYWDGVYTPGKTAQHLRGMYLSYGGHSHFISGDYLILCWK
ncbi:hypothetical protein FRB91_009215 [Serendipita sp. 411]|nr:hypothetical protein FRC15_006448 [Serendipita sp. 397]KAG8770563.1 hypothetical protein FRC16_006307 [Serendipita sp. 398]KAG8832551.1 hypothetical protein FRC18_004846 [Serendipita sp. 400]KAG8861304.1 hypothetical protein FRB91_009215 [Serendipita sp. 411]